MSKKSIEDALQSLLPSHSDPLPLELVSLALSLLSQSRTRASSLKAEEEIARPYVCANIACERLKISLNLPKPNPRPPCPPRVYKKLYTYLENALPVSQPKRLQSSNLNTSSPVKTAIPSKSLAVARQVSTPTKSATPAVEKQSASTDEAKHHDYPGAALPVIRQLCKAFNYPSLAPHVYMGVGVIYKLAFPAAHSHGQAGAPSTPRRGRKATTPATITVPSERDVKLLAVSVLIIVMLKVQDMTDIPDEVLLEIAEKGLRILGLDPELRPKVDDWIVKITEEGWAAGMEWFENLPDSVTSMADKESGDVDVEEREAEVGRKRRRWMMEGRGGLQAGLGTMMQDKVDWLSEEKRLDYEEWKVRVMERVEAIEKDGEDDMMMVE